MLKKYFLTNLPGFDLHIAGGGGGGGYTVSLACSQFLVFVLWLYRISNDLKYLAPLCPLSGK